jgi:hypothetical protein
VSGLCCVNNTKVCGVAGPVEEGDSVTMVMEYVGNTEDHQAVEMERAVTVREEHKKSTRLLSRSPPAKLLASYNPKKSSTCT